MLGRACAVRGLLCMIDLRRKNLPCELWCGEREGWLAIQTDYRVWLEFDRSLREDHMASYCVFADAVPAGTDWIPSALEFLQAKNATPHMEETTDDGLQTPTLDPILDGSYIYASFLQAYGIDLLQTDMHWHVFCALLVSLPQETMISRIRSYRSWQKSNRKHEDAMLELRRIWALPTPEDSETLAWQQAAFGAL